MYALISRPRLIQVTFGSFNGLARLQPYSQELGKEILPTDPGVKPFSAIPGPPSLPIIGNLFSYYRGTYDLKTPLETYSSFLKDYGPLVKENLFLGKTLVHVFRQEDLQKVYVSESPLRLPTRHSHSAMKKYRKSRKHEYHHIGVAASNGEEWNSYRNLFTDFWANLYDRSSVVPAIEGIADDLIKYMKSNLDHKGEISVFPALYYYTLEVIGVLILGSRMGCFNENCREDVTRFIEAVHDSHYAIHQLEHKPYILAREAYKTLEVSQDYMAHYIARHMNFLMNLIDPWVKSDDPLARFNEDEDSGGVDDVHNEITPLVSDSFLYRNLKDRMPRPEILPMAVDFFQGGIHSTAHTLAFALYHLAQNPDKQQILREELVKHFPSKSEKVGDSLSRSRCVYKAIFETLRLNPPTIGTGRVLAKDLVLSGYRVPEGTQVILHHQIAQTSEDYYSEPLKFDPERKNVPFVYNPFGFNSRRMCMGVKIANLEMKMALVKIFRYFEVSYHYDKVGIVNYLINEPDRPIKLRLKEI